MKIRVIREDIRKAKRLIKLGHEDCQACPIAQAIRRKTKKRVSVYGGVVDVGDKTYYLPAVAEDFVYKFDNNQPVTGFKFELSVNN